MNPTRYNPTSLCPSSAKDMCALCTTDGSSVYSSNLLYSYMASVFISDKSIFSQLQHKSGNDHNITGNTWKTIRQLMDTFPVRDKLLILIYLNGTASVPSAYTFAGFYQLTNISKFRYILGSSVKKGLIQKVTISGKDLPIFGQIATSYFTLTQNGLDYLRQHYPDLYLPTLSDEVSLSKLLHVYHSSITAMQIFYLLSKNGFPDIGIEYEHLIDSAGKRYNYGNGRGTLAKKTADTISDVYITAGRFHIYVEQDMDTERIYRLQDKIRSYCSNNKIGYGSGYPINPETSIILFSSHTTHVRGRESVLLRNVPYMLSMANPPYFSGEYLAKVCMELDNICPGFTCEEYLANKTCINMIERSMRRVAENESRNGKALYSLIIDEEHLPFSLSCIDEIIRFHHNILCCKKVTLAIMAYAYTYDERYMLHADPPKEEYKNFIYGAYRLYGSHFTIATEKRVAEIKRSSLSNYYLNLARAIEPRFLYDFSEELKAISEGLCLYVIPELSLGKYSALLYPAMTESMLSPFVKEYDQIHGYTGRRSYYTVSPGYAGAPQTLKGAAVEVLCGNNPLRLRNLFIPSDGSMPSICFEFTRDVFSKARIWLYLSYVMYETSINKDYVPAKRIVLVCEDECEIEKCRLEFADTKWNEFLSFLPYDFPLI